MSVALSSSETKRLRDLLGRVNLLPQELEDLPGPPEMRDK